MSIRSIVPTARSGSTGKVVSAREAVRLIRIGDTVAIGGFFQIGLALEVVHELGALFEDLFTQMVVSSHCAPSRSSISNVASSR